MTYKFDLTKDRSAVNGKYQFQFISGGQRAVVPILQRYQSGEYRIIGTGSYLIAPNIFVTAKHIFEGDDINDDDGFSVVLEGVLEPVPLIRAIPHESLDLSFVILDPESSHLLEGIRPVAVMDSPMSIGEVSALYGYSHSIVDPTNTVELDNGDVFQDFGIRAKWELGGVLETHENGVRMVPGLCYETSILAEGRDSGAPMFNSNGFMVGVLSTSYEFASGLPNSICTSILQLRDIPIDGTPVNKLWRKTDRIAICRPICG